jgi:hypothetical protein
MSKKPPIKKVKRNLSKVKCFNYDNNGHLTKDCPKPPWVSECIAQSKLIFQGDIMAEVKVHKSKTSNLLKLNCKINDKLMCCLLDLGTINSFMILQVVE